MTWLPCLIRGADRGGRPVVRLSHPQLHRYLEFVAARTRPNRVLATGYDLKVPGGDRVDLQLPPFKVDRVDPSCGPRVKGMCYLLECGRHRSGRRPFDVTSSQTTRPPEQDIAKDLGAGIGAASPESSPKPCRISERPVVTPFSHAQASFWEAASRTAAGEIEVGEALPHVSSMARPPYRVR